MKLEANLAAQLEAQNAESRLRDTKFWLFTLRTLLDAVINGAPDQVPSPEYILAVLDNSSRDALPDAEAIIAVIAALPEPDRAALVEKLYDTYCINCGQAFDKLGDHNCPCARPYTIWSPVDPDDEEFFDEHES